MTMLVDKNIIQLYKKESAEVFNNIDDNEINAFIGAVIRTYTMGGRMFACGCGGNAGFVSNLTGDLAQHPFVAEDKSKKLNIQPRFSVVDLTCQTALITGIMNDLGPDQIFAEQLRGHGVKIFDCLFAISGSGNSANIVEALRVAKEGGAKTVLMTRNRNGKCAKFASTIIEVKGDSNFPGQTGKNNNNFHFEDCIAKITHIATGILKKYVEESLIAEQA